MEQQEVDRENQNLRRLIQQLVRLWNNDWNNANYANKILPELLLHPNSRSKTEDQILQCIERIATSDELNQLPKMLLEEHEALKTAPRLRAKLEQMIRHFQLAEADMFLQNHQGLLSKKRYESLRKGRILRRRHSVKEELGDFHFSEAEQLMGEACEVLRPNEAQELRNWFQTEATRSAKMYLKREIIPLLRQHAFAEARRKFGTINRFLDAELYMTLEANYASESNNAQFDGRAQEVKVFANTSQSKNDMNKQHPDMPVSIHEPGVHQQDTESHVRMHTVNKLPDESGSWRKYVVVGEQSLRQRHDVAIRCEVQKRKIAHLVHFTRISNLKSILDKGLLPRSKLELTGVKFTPNDLRRLDNMRNATSLSISFPNYKMFYKYRQQDPSIHWAILLLDPSILWEYTCFFFRSNAASSLMRNTERFRKKGADAFAELFKVIDSEPSREETGIPEYYTTDPQAEVLVVGDIPPGKIQMLAVPDRETLMIINRDNGHTAYTMLDTYFKPRQDWKYWT